MFKKVLLASDLSPASEQLTHCSCGFLALGIEEIVLTYCLDTGNQDILQETFQLKIPALEQQAETLAKQGFAVSKEIRLGIPAIEIIRTAEEKRCNLIVIGSHGHNLSDKISLGGVVSAVLYNLTIPALVVRMPNLAGYRAQFANPLEHVLFPTDFSENADSAFILLEQLVQLGAKKVTILHIQDHIIGKHLKDRLEIFNRVDAEKLKYLSKRLLACGKTEIRTEIRYGGVAELILEQITTNSISMVVIGAQGKGRIEKTFIGGVTNKVLRNSPVPVLVVPFVSSLSWSSDAQESWATDELKLKNKVQNEPA